MRTLKLIILNLLFLYFSNISAQSVEYERIIGEKNGTMTVHYFENEPNAYSLEGQMKGIEVDILEQFKAWIKENKGVELNFEYISHPAFDEMYANVKESKGNNMGIGTITITDERATEVDFSAPYMKNVSILVSSGQVATARSKAELKELLSSMRAVTVKGSIHETHLKALYREFGLAPNIKFIKDPMDVFEEIKTSARTFGYVDVITFWKFIKKNDYYVKMHSIASYRDENFGFIFPKGSGWDITFNEFFESGFGFTATKEYRKILEKHLSYEVINSVELNP